jgi:hypothetical protein
MSSLSRDLEKVGRDVDQRHVPGRPDGLRDGNARFAVRSSDIEHAQARRQPGTVDMRSRAARPHSDSSRSHFL